MNILRIPQRVNMTEPLNDYAYPCMMAENALKRVHLAMLDNAPTKALFHAVEALVETVRMVDAIKHAKEREDALRKQA